MSVVFCSVLAAQTLPSPTVNSTATPATRKPLPDAPGKETFLRVCSQCHSADIVIFYDRSEEQWSYTVHQMADNGANATDQEFEQVLDYLIKYVAIIDMNTVDADTLERSLGISRNQADAIVGFRSGHGDFKSLEDLKQVPGVEFGQLEQRKDRLKFRPSGPAQN